MSYSSRIMGDAIEGATEEILGKVGKAWTKPGTDEVRYYIEAHECERYKTGNVRWAWIADREISNNQYCKYIEGSKIWADSEGRVHVDRCGYEPYAKEMLEYAEGLIREEIAKAQPAAEAVETDVPSGEDVAKALYQKPAVEFRMTIREVPDFSEADEAAFEPFRSYIAEDGRIVTVCAIDDLGEFGVVLWANDKSSWVVTGGVAEQCLTHVRMHAADVLPPQKSRFVEGQVYTTTYATPRKVVSIWTIDGKKQVRFEGQTLFQRVEEDEHGEYVENGTGPRTYAALRVRPEGERLLAIGRTYVGSDGDGRTVTDMVGHEWDGLEAYVDGTGPWPISKDGGVDVVRMGSGETVRADSPTIRIAPRARPGLYADREGGEHRIEWVNRLTGEIGGCAQGRVSLAWDGGDRWREVLTTVDGDVLTPLEAC